MTYTKADALADKALMQNATHGITRDASDRLGAYIASLPDPTPLPEEDVREALDMIGVQVVDGELNPDLIAVRTALTTAQARVTELERELVEASRSDIKGEDAK